MLALMRGRQITGHGLELLKDLPLKDLFLQRTALDDERLAGLFTEAERKAYEDARAYKTMKNRISLDSPELQAPVHALQEFFDDMNRWEQMAERKGSGSQADIDELFARRVSWMPRPGWRPIHLTWRRGGTYTDYRLTAGERVTKSKFWIYAEQGIFYYRYLMRLVDGGELDIPAAYRIR